MVELRGCDTMLALHVFIDLKQAEGTSLKPVYYPSTQGAKASLLQVWGQLGPQSKTISKHEQQSKDLKGGGFSSSTMYL